MQSVEAKLPHGDYPEADKQLRLYRIDAAHSTAEQTKQTATASSGSEPDSGAPIQSRRICFGPNLTGLLNT